MINITIIILYRDRFIIYIIWEIISAIFLVILLHSKQPYDNNKHNNKPDNIYQVIFTIIKKFYFPVKCSLMYCFQLFLLNIIVIIIEYIMHEYFIVVNDQL